MIWPDYGPHDEATAHRLLLAVVDNNEEAYQSIITELDCTECLRRVINALVCTEALSWLTRDGDNPDDPAAQAQAIRDITHNIAVFLDECTEEGGP